MPRISRLRVINTAFNGARSFHHDTKMGYFGKTGVYDLYNGGGKSVLLMMVLQTVLPGFTLDPDHEIKEIFENTRPNHTSHSLVEWQLDEGSEYKYLLTGFCIRAKRDGGLNVYAQPEEEDVVRGIEYYSYYFLYNEPNEFDIENIEIISKDQGKQRVMSYDKLKELLQKLKARDLPVDICTTRTKYWAFLRQYNIIELEWKIIRDLNQKENYIVPYFRENNSSRKVIENLLIKVIEDLEKVNLSLNRKDLPNIILAKGLLGIRENLKRLKKDKDNKTDYEKIKESYIGLKALEKTLLEHYIESDEIKAKFISVANKIRMVLQKVTSDIETYREILIETRDVLQKTQHQLDCLNAQDEQLKMAEIDKELELLNNTLGSATANEIEAERGLNTARAQNAYCEYRETSSDILTTEIEIRLLEQSSEEIDRDFKQSAYNYREETTRILTVIEQMITQLAGQFSSEQTKEGELGSEQLDAHGKTATLKADLTSGKKHLAKLDREHKVIAQRIESNGGSEWLFQPKESLIAIKDTISGKNAERDNESQKLNTSIELKPKLEKDLAELKAKSDVLDERIKPLLKFQENYLAEEQIFKDKCLFYEVVQVTENLRESIFDRKKKVEDRIFELRASREIEAQKLRLIEEKGFYIPNHEVLKLHRFLEKKYGSGFLGAEWLNDNPKDREELLRYHPLLPYSVIVPGNVFDRVKSNLSVLKEVSDYAIPIVNLNAIKSNVEQEHSSVLFAVGDTELYTKPEALASYLYSLTKKQEEQERKVQQLSHDIEVYETDLVFINRFIDLHEEYPSRLSDIESIQSEKLQNDNKYAIASSQLRQTEGQIQVLTTLVHAIDLQIKKLGQNSEDLKLYIEKQEEIDLSALEIADTELEWEQAKKDEALITIELKETRRSIEMLRGLITEEERKRDRLNDEMKNVPIYEGVEFLGLGYEVAKSSYLALSESLSGKVKERDGLMRNLESFQTKLENQKETVQTFGFEVELFLESESMGNIIFRTGYEQIQRLASELNIRKSEKESAHEKVEECKRTHTEAKTKFEYQVKLIEESGSQYATDPLISDRGQVAIAVRELKNKLKQGKLDEKNALIDLNGFEEQESQYDKKLTKFETKIMEFESDSSLVSEEELDYDALDKELKTNADKLRRVTERLRRMVQQIIEQAQDLEIKDYVLILEKFNLPSNLDEVKGQISSFEDCIRIISDKIEELDDEINNLEGYRENHAQLCLQRAKDIMEELRKFNSLPAIMVSGQPVKMVQIEFDNSKSEEDKLNGIKNYLTELAGDVEKTPEEISRALSSKYLLSKITDLDKAKIKIYKIEAHAGDSRPLDWKKAVGSSGQSSSIYVVFLLYLMSYIRLLRNQPDLGSTPKTLFLDNPFGTFISPYLWDPIFKILRDNNVQLIALGHKTDTAISSMFDIQYVLGEEILSDKRRVIVKEIRTEVDMNQMKFEKIFYDQTSLF